jgi:hypothetical protein
MLLYSAIFILIASIKFEIGAIKLHLAEMEFLIFLLYGTSILILPLGLNFSSHCDCLNDGNEYSYGTLKQNLIDGMSKIYTF